MADSAVPITAGAGTNIDTRTVTGGDHRQVMVPAGVGDADIATFTTGGTKVALDVNIASTGGGTAQASGTLSGSGTSVSAAVAASGNATIVIFGGTYTALPIAFEASVDGGTNYFPVDASRADGSVIDVAPILPSPAVRAWNVIVPGFSHVRVRQTAAASAQTGNPSVIIAQGPSLFDPSPTVALIDGQKDTHVTSITGLASNIAGDFFYLRGSATAGRVVRLTRLEATVTITGTITSAGILLQLLKRSSGYTGGTAGGVPTVIPVDSSQALALMAQPGTFTVAPTPGTLIGTVRVGRFQAAASTFTFAWDFGGGRPSKCPVLRGNAEYLALNQSAAVAGTTPVLSWAITAETTEEG